MTRARFGCDTVADTPRVVIDGIGFHSCLCKFQHPLFHAYLDIGARLDKGLLPDSGPYLDQPAQLLDAVNLLSRLRAEAQQAEQAKQDKRAAQHGRRQ